MPASATFEALLDDYLAKRDRLAEVKLARQAGLGLHVKATFTPVDANAQVDVRLAQLATMNVDEFYVGLGSLVESHIRDQVDRAKKALDRQYEIEVG